MKKALSAEKYRDRFSELCAQIQSLSRKETETKEFSEKRKFKLPQIELKKFTGDAKEVCPGANVEKIMRIQVFPMRIRCSISCRLWCRKRKLQY
ncbi:hypothetical protein AVEN_227064-1 [Araneus ventricosus]|uniref:Uncharacterized protein n=1 Tax=Araneus ventricosus TaxID=182803 RepID=A0A4Y2LB91_ARAVE|nr:hypothetical protein AVEN_227064-1 [Araneus ventricosus]